MELRRVLFEYNISQAAMVRGAQAVGFRISNPQMSQVVRLRRRAFPKEREAIQRCLAEFGVPADVIASIPEIATRPDGRLKAVRPC